MGPDRYPQLMTAATLPFQTRSDTSLEAAQAAAPNATTMRQVVLDTIKLPHAAGFGWTDQELEAHLGWSGNSIRPRRRELEKAGLVEDTGKRRKTPSGRQATVWAAVRITMPQRPRIWFQEVHPDCTCPETPFCTICPHCTTVLVAGEHCIRCGCATCFDTRPSTP